MKQQKCKGEEKGENTALSKICVRKRSIFKLRLNNMVKFLQMFLFTSDGTKGAE